MDTENKLFFIYSRKSKFTGKGESIENQIVLCKQYIHNYFPDVDDSRIVVFEDEGFSGGNIERPQFKEMLRQIKTKPVSHIICYRLDRISRNIGDFAKLIKDFTDLKIEFVSIKEQFDTTTSMGRAMMYIASIFSNLERETIAERIRDNMYELAKTGRWLGGNTPTGYKSEAVEKITVEGKIKTAYKLTTIDDEVELVKLIFNKFLETCSITKTESYLITNDIQTKKGNRFTRFAIKNILENPVYMIADKKAHKYFYDLDLAISSDISEFDAKHGMMVYNKTYQEPGKSIKVRDMSEWVIAVGKHEGIISSDDWINVHNILVQNKTKSYRNTRSNAALLTGVMRCAQCGSYMRPKITRRKNGSDEIIFNYLCELKEKSHMEKCNVKTPNGNMIDELVCKEIRKLSSSPSQFIEELNQCKKALLENKSVYDSELDSLLKKQKDNDKKISTLVSTLANIGGTPAEQYVLREIEELDKKSKGLEPRINELQAITKKHILSDEEFNLLRELLTSFDKTFDDMTIEQKRAALRTIVKRVAWDGENIHVYVFGYSEDDVELPSIDDYKNTEPLCEYRE